MRHILPILAFTLLAFSTTAQPDPFQIQLKPIVIEGLPGVQSYVYGQHNGLWLIIGGRTDGLHRRQPFASFDPEGRNTQLTVIDPTSQRIWAAPLSSLSLPLQDQLSSTNMEFYQEGDILYLIGGYGHSQTIDSKLTYALLTSVDVPGVIEAVKQGGDLTPYFRQTIDQQFAVTGGHLDKLYDTYYLVGGQNFIGNYNPMNHPTFTQEYTNAIRTFLLEDDGTTLHITHLPSITDTAAFHRRDYNVVPQIMHDGQEGLTAFSGVFQINADLPFLNAVHIDREGYRIDPDFAQYYNHYHCATLPMYSSKWNEMHTVFFGGIAQYYEQAGKLIEDNDVPFVKTIARVTRDANGNMNEYKLPIEMPSYLGASAEFIPIPGIAKFDNGVIKLDELNSDSTLVGYIFGGIASTAANIFFTNEGEESVAQNILYEVYVMKGNTTSTHLANTQSNNGLQLQIYPNPTDGLFHILFNLQEKKQVKLTISDEKGKVVLKEDISDQLHIGQNRIEKKIKLLKIGGIYFVTLSTGEEAATQKIMVKE